MFTWICPKCGGEVPPSYDECPQCARPASAQASSGETTVAVKDAPAVRETAAAPVSAPAAQAGPPPPPPQPYQAGAASHAAPVRSGLSPTLTAILACGGIAALLAVLYLYVLPSRARENTAKAAPALQTPAEAASAHPLAKHLEVTGVRVQESRGGAVNVQYLVVNHSPADLPPMTITVTLQSADRTFFEFPVKVPSLGPYDVKDLKSTLKTDLKPYELPDWQMIEPKFRIHPE